MIGTSFSADYIERKKDPGVAKHNGQYMGKFIQILNIPHSGSYKFSTSVKRLRCFFLLLFFLIASFY